MKVSYGITVHNEQKELETLFESLKERDKKNETEA